MELPASKFETTDWDDVEREIFLGVSGTATWRTRWMGDARIRIVEYSAGYVADHWCDRGHILFVIDGELTTELADGRSFKLSTGMSYQVSTGGDAAHMSKSIGGAKLMVID